MGVVCALEADPKAAGLREAVWALEADPKAAGLRGEVWVLEADPKVAGLHEGGAVQAADLHGAVCSEEVCSGTACSWKTAAETEYHFLP